MTYRLAIFDFDGTLADSLPFFLSVFNELADRHGFRKIDVDEAAALRRLHAREAMRHVGMPAHKLPGVARDFIGMMRERRQAIRPFPGAPELLIELARVGIQVGVVSSNAQDNVTGILGPHAAKAIRHFSCGMSIFGKRAHLRRILRRGGVPPQRALYIGDQPTDLEAAHAERIAFGAVAWGYADSEQLRARGADHVFRRMDDIRVLFAAA